MSQIIGFIGRRGHPAHLLVADLVIIIIHKN